MAVGGTPEGVRQDPAMDGLWTLPSVPVEVGSLWKDSGNVVITIYLNFFNWPERT